MSLHRKRVIRRRTITNTSEVPSGVPSRQATKRGYVELVWRIGPNEYLRCYEHRLVAGFPTGHVHHRNDIKGDNSPDNLQPLAASRHIKEHGLPGRNRIDLNTSAVSSLFAQGYGRPTIAKRLNVSQMAVGRTMRSLGLWRRPGRVANASIESDPMRVYEDAGA